MYGWSAAESRLAQAAGADVSVLYLIMEFCLHRGSAKARTKADAQRPTAQLLVQRQRRICQRQRRT
jgi:hypothetical protein